MSFPYILWIFFIGSLEIIIIAIAVISAEKILTNISSKFIKRNEKERCIFRR